MESEKNEDFFGELTTSLVEPTAYNVYSFNLEPKRLYRNVVMADVADVLKSEWLPLEDKDMHDMDSIVLMNTDIGSILYKYGNIIMKHVIRNGNDEKYDQDFKLFQNEILIGLEINKLQCENFVHTIGYASNLDNCKIPGLDGYFKSRPCLYLYVKEVKGPTMVNFLRTASLSQIKDILRKLSKGYKIALDALDFTHYDLHLSNIIISTNDNGELIPVIIDFGSSHIAIPEGHLGERWTQECRYDDRSSWIMDWFKLLGYIYVYTDTDSYLNKRIYGDAQDILRDASRIGYMGVDRNVIIELYKYHKIPKEFKRRVTDYIVNARNRLKDEILIDTEKIIRELDRLEEHLSKYCNAVEVAEKDGRENGSNLQAIREYSLSLLKFFRPDLNKDEFILWLNTYNNPYHSVTATKLGYAKPFDDFISLLNA
jgi:hypothetical protein